MSEDIDNRIGIMNMVNATVKARQEQAEIQEETVLQKMEEAARSGKSSIDLGGITLSEAFINKLKANGYKMKFFPDDFDDYGNYYRSNIWISWDHILKNRDNKENKKGLFR